MFSKTKWFKVSVSMLALISLTLTTLISAAVSTTPVSAQSSYMCGLSIYVQDRNNVTLNVDVEGGSGYPARLEWGDGSYVDLTSGQGQHIWHSYPYNVGWFTYYTPALYVPGVETCRTTIGISDYRGASFCNLYGVEVGHNELTVGADVNGPGDYPGHLDWGDGTYVDVGEGPGSNIHHAYTYTVGGITTYTMNLAVPGADTCTGTYTIDDTGQGQSWMSNTTPHTGSVVNWEFPGSEPVSHYVPAPSGSQVLNNNWYVGGSVGLCLNTQIRTGSGLGYTVHTVVPVNNWPVDVIGGPRYADGYTWWDISRSDGGTGWVRQDQADCNEGSPSNPPTPPDSGLTVYNGWSGAPWSNTYLQVTAYNLRLRALASMNGTVMGYVVQGQYYKLIDESQSPWGKIETQNGTQGWIYLPNYTVITYPNQTPPSPPQICEVTPNAHINWHYPGSFQEILQHWFVLEIPKFIMGISNYEIYFEGELVPDNVDHIWHQGGLQFITDTTFALGIDTHFVSQKGLAILIDSNWKIKYPCQ